MRVWVTGLGIVSPLAFGARATMDRLVAGAHAFGPIGLFDVSDQKTKWGAEVSGLDVAAVAPKGDLDSWSRTDAMAVVAAREALAEARLDPTSLHIDLALGGTTGGMFETERLLAEMFADPARQEPQGLMLSHPLSATSDRVQKTLGPFRRARTFCSACSGGANAILAGAAWIRSGRSERVLAGGADGLCRLTFTGFNALGAVAPEVCRPFDRRRAGLGLGEGAAFLVLEGEPSARERGAVPLAELAGWGLGSEAHHITNPEKEGETAALLVTRALVRAGITAAELDYVNAHGTGTLHNDAMEARALHKALGHEARRVAVSSCKGQIGHTLGASGAIEAAVTVLAVHRGEIPPTGGLEEIDPACDLAHVTHRGHKATVRAALSNSFGFGGTDTVLLFTRPGFVTPAAPAKSSRRRVVVTGAATMGPLGLAGSLASVEYLRPGPGPQSGSLAFDAKDHFDLARARRMDRGARLLTLSLQAALLEAGRTGGEVTELGAIGGSAYGTVDASAEFIQRIYEKGPRLASPLVFPNLVPSSLVAHAAIYLGLSGPVLAVADLGITGEASFLLACELIEAGEAPAMLAASVEEQSRIAERVLGPVCAGSSSWSGIRTEGSSAVLVEDEAVAARRGASVLARVAFVANGRGPFGPRSALLPGPSSARPLVIVSRRDEELRRVLNDTRWSDVECLDVATRAGNHEGLGGFAIACAAGAIASGQAQEALVLGLAPDRWMATILVRP